MTSILFPYFLLIPTSFLKSYHTYSCIIYYSSSCFSFAFEGDNSAVFFKLQFIITTSIGTSISYAFVNLQTGPPMGVFTNDKLYSVVPSFKIVSDLL